MESCASSEKHEQVHASNLALFPISSTPLDLIRSFPLLGHPHPHALTLSSKPTSSSSSSLPFLTIARGASDVAAQLQKSIVSNVDRFLKMVDGLWSQNAALALDKVLSLYSCLQTCFHFQIPRRVRERQNIILSNNNFAAILPGGDSVAGVVVANGILNFLNIYNTLLIVRIVLTWFPNAPMAIVSPLSTICDPYLNVFRGLIPPLGGTLDLSPILAFLVLNAFTSTAAALPAELPPPRSQEFNNMPMPPPHSSVTSSQKKWLRRLAQSRDKPKSPPAAN